MNKTQKEALFTLGIAVLLLAFGVIIFIDMLSPGGRPTTLIKVWLLLICAFMAISAVLLRRKQSPAEPDFDERDNTIKKNAVLVSFVSVWVLLVAASIIPIVIGGDEGSIPVCLLPVINFGVFFIVMLIYSVAILAQYRWRDKDGEK